MALDGTVIAGIVHELNNKVLNGRVYKIYQPEVDELCIVIKNKSEKGNETYRLEISADASLPFIHLTNVSKDNPMTAPNFCMLLRKYIGNGRIMDIRQPNFERIIEVTIEHLDDMGDLCSKKLIIEIMGKHSNIIFTDSNGMIIDSIKHISHLVSSVREVLPGRQYVYPLSQDKKNPCLIDSNYFINHIMREPMAVSKAIYTSLTGISPAMANEIVYRAGIDGSLSTDAVSSLDKEHIFECYNDVFKCIINGDITPCIAYHGDEPVEFAVVNLSMYEESDSLKFYNSISQVIEEFYNQRSVVTRIKQRSTDLRKIVSNAVERTSKKYDLQLRQLKDTDKRDKYKVYGELLMTYGYAANEGDKSITCDNYYTNELITIPLDSDLSAMDNAKRYFNKYNKLKRTYEALTELTAISKSELDHLIYIKNSLDYSKSEDDLAQIKQEMIEYGYIRGKHSSDKKRKQPKSNPLHYVSSDGYDIFVGKNNYQNEELTLKNAEALDMWFHAKNIPGSHVIIKTKGETELPDRTYEEAARLAAYYSSGKSNPKVEIDYTIRKNLKKPPKAKPGFVIYHTNFSITVKPDIHDIREFD